jgi:hypothetical protein
MADRKPSKPWRVYGANDLFEDYGSERAAYEAVRELTGFGHPATVHRWQDGRWRLYEHVEPPERSAD